MLEKENQFLISENAIPALQGLKVGQVMEGLINYQIIEKTKSYIMIRVRYFNPDYQKRKL